MQFKLSGIFLIFLACNAGEPQNAARPAPAMLKTGGIPSILLKKIEDIPVPEGFTRTVEEPGSFAQWLRKVPLKKDNTVYLYNGEKKQNQEAQHSVLDFETGNKNLQQCADAVMKLRAMYLFNKKAYSSILFFDNEGKRYAFDAPFTQNHLNSYLERVFGMCGTASLSKQMKKTNIKQMEAGNAFVRGGFPGHAAIVVDMATDGKGRKFYLLAQSYMPAQDIHILKNPMNETFSPWYELNSEEVIETPEYTFKSDEIKAW